MSNEFKQKSFWERPEGLTGMITIGLGGLGLFFAGPTLIKLFDTAITLVGNAITLTVLGVILFGLIMIISNPKVHNLVGYFFKSCMRWITGRFVEIDPIGIMKSFIEDLRKKNEVLDGSIAKLEGQVKICESQVRKNENESKEQLAIFAEARKQGKTSAAQVSGRQSERLNKQNTEQLKPLLLQMQVHLKALRKYKEVTTTVIDDLANEVKAQEMQRNLIKTSWGAMMTAKKILNGGTDERELFDQAMEYVVHDFNMKMGDIDHFINSTQGFVESLDIQNGVFEEAALQRLQEWEQNADSILLGQSKAQLLEHDTVNSTLNLNIGVPVAVQTDYERLLSKK